MSGFTARLSFLLNAHIRCEYLVQDHGNAPLSASSAFTRSHTAYDSQITNGISCPISNEHHAQILMWSVLFINNLTLRSIFISCHDIAAWINFWLAQLSVCFNVQDERIAFSPIPLQNTPTLRLYIRRSLNPSIFLSRHHKSNSLKVRKASLRAFGAQDLMVLHNMHSN